MILIMYGIEIDGKHRRMIHDDDDDDDDTNEMGMIYK
jgi:hypothetical protein